MSLGCCGKRAREIEPMEVQVGKSIHSSIHATKARPRFSYSEYSKGAMPGSVALPIESGSAAFAFRGLGNAGICRENPLFREDSVLSPQSSSASHYINAVHRKASDEEDFAGFGNDSEGFAGFGNDSEGFAGFGNDSEGDGYTPPQQNRRASMSSVGSVGSVDSVLFRGLPIASVDSLMPTHLHSGVVRGGGGLTEHGRSPSPFSVANALGGVTIAGEGIETVVLGSGRLPRSRHGHSKRGREQSTFADVIFSPPYTNRKLLETYMFTVADFDELDGRAVKTRLEAAATLFGALDTSAAGEIDYPTVLAATISVDADGSDREEIKEAFTAADDDHTGTLRYRQFANFMLIREGFITDPMLDPHEPTLAADGHLVIPDGSQYGSDQGLKDHAVSTPGMLRKQPRGELRVLVAAESTATGYKLEVKVEEAVNLVSPATLIETALVTPNGKRCHCHTAKFKASQHPRSEHAVAWTVSTANGEGAVVVIRYHRKSTKSKVSLGTVAFPLADVLSNDVTTAGWFHLMPEPIGATQHFRCTNVPGPGVCSPALPRGHLSRIREGESGHRVLSPLSLLDVRLTRTLGTGSYGKVMLAIDRSGAQFAIKGLSKAATVAKDEVEQVLVERQVLTQFHHPSIARLFSTFATDNFLYFCLEPLLGGSLADVAVEGKGLSSAAIAFFGAEMLLGIWHLHDCGVIHRDISLDNVLLDGSGHLRLADFGLAKILTTEHTTRTFCGTPEFVAPEMLAGGSYGRSVDYWALGVLLYRLRIGAFPFPRGADADPEGIYVAVRGEVVPKLPHSLDSSCAHAIRGLLAYDIKSRLGCDMHRGGEELRAAPLFAKTNWAVVARRGKRPPIKPPKTKPKASKTRPPETALCDATKGETMFSLDPIAELDLRDADRGLFSGFSWSQDHERDELLGLRTSPR